MNIETRIDNYAKLAIKVGINVQPGETLLIRCDVNSIDFARKCFREAYKAGAKHVYVEIGDEIMTRDKYLLAPDDSFGEFPDWQRDKMNQLAKEGGSFLSIISDNPNLLDGISPDKISKSQRARSKALEEYYSYMLTDKCKWSIVAIPSLEWAKQVHPTLDDKAALDKLWEQILDCSRIDENPELNWEDHIKNLKVKTDFLNENKFEKLVYKSDKTYLTIHLPKKHIWQSGNSKDTKGYVFTPNIPTEEIYSMPHKYKVDGIVYSTKPLIHGALIDEFWLKFENGKVIDFGAKEGYEHLKKLLETDDGSSRIGEVALVPHHSPISNTNTVFYNTLFDENASCHLALGAAYSTNIVGGENMNDEEKDKNGVNDSIEHVDFMIGSEKLNITGIKSNGEEVEIFKDGNWAF